MAWEQLALVISVVAPLVGIPLGVITLYLRAIREHQTTTMAEMSRRIEMLERSINEVLRLTAGFERDYTTKEEWVRESMLARQRLDRLADTATRLETELETGKSLAAELSRATTALVHAAGSSREQAPT